MTAGGQNRTVGNRKTNIKKVGNDKNTKNKPQFTQI